METPPNRNHAISSESIVLDNVADDVEPVDGLGAGHPAEDAGRSPRPRREIRLPRRYRD